MSWLKMKEAAAKKLKDIMQYETSFQKVELELVEIKYTKNKLTADF
jgi:Asp-tRNA(Asn)/Glu-tRNA(Gln) amidotransferase C subunit